MLLVSYSRNHCQIQYQEAFPTFSSECYIVLCHIDRSSIHSELIFVYSVRQESNFILFNVEIQFSQHYLSKKCSFLIVSSWHPCLISFDNVHKSLFMNSLFYSSGLYVYLYVSATVLITINLQCVLKPGDMRSLFFFLFPGCFGYSRPQVLILTCL